jgi:hypothetical protein
MAMFSGGVQWRCSVSMFNIKIDVRRDSLESLPSDIHIIEPHPDLPPHIPILIPVPIPITLRLTLAEPTTEEGMEEPRLNEYDPVQRVPYVPLGNDEGDVGACAVQEGVVQVGEEGMLCVRVGLWM